MCFLFLVSCYIILNWRMIHETKSKTRRLPLPNEAGHSTKT